MGSAISSLIVAAERGDKPAAEALFAALYAELHRLAKRELARHGLPMSLSATTLLHEAYLDMASRNGPSFPDRARFMAVSYTHLDVYKRQQKNFKSTISARSGSTLPSSSNVSLIRTSSR